MDEIWLPVIDFEGLYEVSSMGRVRSLSRVVASSRGQRTLRERFLKPGSQPDGHLHVVLSRHNSQKNAKVHRLVALAFLGQPQPGQEVLHGDGNPGNNSLENLRWGTRSENVLDSVLHGTYRNGNMNKTECPARHEYSDDNTYTRNGKRYCKSCKKAGKITEEEP